MNIYDNYFSDDKSKVTINKNDIKYNIIDKYKKELIDKDIIIREKEDKINELMKESENKINE